MVLSSGVHVLYYTAASVLSFYRIIPTWAVTYLLSAKKNSKLASHSLNSLPSKCSKRLAVIVVCFAHLGPALKKLIAISGNPSLEKGEISFIFHIITGLRIPIWQLLWLWNSVLTLQGLLFLRVRSTVVKSGTISPSHVHLALKIRNKSQTVLGSN